MRYATWWPWCIRRTCFGPRRWVWLAAWSPSDMIGASLPLLAILLAPMRVEAVEPSLLDKGYRQMYNLQFQAAHESFQEWEKSHPTEPLGPVSDAAAFLFSE